MKKQTMTVELPRMKLRGGAHMTTFAMRDRTKFNRKEKHKNRSYD